MTVTIINSDYEAALRSMPDESVDMILADPPYGETSLPWDKWQDGWPAIVRRVLKRTGSMWCFGSTRMFFEHVHEFQGWRLAQDIVWEKHNGSGFQADRFKRVHENALQFYRSDASWGEVFKATQYTNDARARTVRRKTRPTHMGEIDDGPFVSIDGGPRLMRSVIYCRSEHGRAAHPTQKPIGIVEPLILNACPEGGVVLDPFAGSGTTGVVARRHNRKAILVEGQAEFIRVIEQRLDEDAPLFFGDQP